jgi:signal transduction histidine kinase
MLKSFKTKIMITYMIIISVLLLAALSAIYIFTYNSTYEIIQRDLFQTIIEWKRVEGIIEEYGIESKISDLDVTLVDMGEYRRIPWYLRNSIFVRIDPATSNETILAMNNDHKGIYYYLIENHKVEEDKRYQFGFEGKEWIVWHHIGKNSNSQTYTFMNISTKAAYLDRLIVTCIIVFSSALIIIFIISLLMTNRAVKPIEYAIEKQKQFISDASHELRTPLAAISANAEVVIKRKKKQLGTDLKWLEYIKEETERMGLLTDELLYLAEIENKYNPSEVRHRFNFSDEVKKQVIGFEAVVFEKNIDFNYDIENGIEINGNREKLSQVIIILINNALKYTDEKGKIEVKFEKIRNYAVFCVSNTGDGIEAEELTKIFDRFYRSDNVRNSGDGSYGLGLSIAKAIVESHGGDLSCESKPGETTKFTMKLKT